MSLDRKDRKKYFNFLNTTSTFKNLIFKYQRKKQDSIAKNDKKFLLKNVQRKIQEIESEEQDNDFIISEVRRNAQINKEILYSYGTKALNHIDEIRKLNVTTKIDKSKFFEIDKDNDIYETIPLNTERSRTLNRKHLHGKIVNFPLIVKSRNKNNLLNKSILDKSFFIKTKKSHSEERSFNDNKYKNNNYSIDTKEKANNINYILNNINLVNKGENDKNPSFLYSKSPLKTDRSIKTKSKKEINTFRKKNPIIDSDYINYIEEINVKFLKHEKKLERYFENNDYGYDLYKLKYNFLKKKYFN